jgi:D-psicose/D-tagatose/L-ribulose 3-epimerase
MNAFGLHALVLISDWDEAGAEKAIRTAAAIGYDIIEVPLFDPAATDLERTRDLLRQHKLTPSVSLGLTAETDISSADVATSRAGVAQLHKVVDATAFIGGTIVAGVIGSAWQKYLGPATDAGYRNAVSGLREVAQEARAKGVVLAIEVVNRFESNLLNTAAQGLRLVEAIGEDNVGVHLDTFHMHIEEADAAAAIRACGSALRYFHVNENHRGYLDAGSIDFTPIFRALVSARYAGAITFEAFSSTTCTPAIAGNAAIWRSVFEDGEDVASRALDFLKSGMASAHRAMTQVGQ